MNVLLYYTPYIYCAAYSIDVDSIFPPNACKSIILTDDNSSGAFSTAPG